MSPSKHTLHLLQKKLHLLLCLSCAVLLFLLSVGIYQRFFADKKQFNQLCTQLFTEFYEKDALSLAFSFADPPQTRTLLPVYQKESYLLEHTAPLYLKRLSQIDSDRLSEKDAQFYHILQEYLMFHTADSNFPYVEEPLAPTGGVQTNLPVLLAEFPVSEKEDIEQYLALLEAIPDYLAGLASYEKDRKEAGYLMSTADIEEVIRQCDKMCSEEGERLFMDSFSALLTQVSPPLSASEKNLYKSKCHRIVTTLIFPAFVSLGDSLLLLKEENIPRQGLFYLEHPEYYAHLMTAKTGSDKTVSEIEQILQQKFNELAGKLNATVLSLPDNLADTTAFSIPDSLSGTAASAGEETEPLIAASERFLLSLQDEMSKDFPPLPDKVSCSIKPVPDCLLRYTAPAYFFMPQINAFLDNSIYINPSDITDSLSLFTTLAHEGYPGHMLMSTYFLSLQDSVKSANKRLTGFNNRRELFSEIPLSQKKTALQNALGYIGYVEGWAMYVEFLSYKYASLTDGEPSSELEQFYELLRLNKELKICLYCLLDIRVHAYGDTAKDIAPYLNNIGITDPSSVDALYTYLVNEPCTYASYYVGYLELLECKELYKSWCEQTNQKYTEKGFHTFYLGLGPCSFSYIKSLLKA